MLIPRVVVVVELKFDLGFGGSLADGRGGDGGGDGGRNAAASASLFDVSGSSVVWAFAEVTESIAD